MRRFALVLTLCVVAMSASARSLSWRDFDVTASLDRDGKLHVVETQQIVFDGDWNGGERLFRIEPDQSLQIDGMLRIAADGREVTLVDGSLDALDHYQLVDGTKLRWRSRMPGDTPFDHTALTYRIRYTLGGIIQRHGSAYALNHDFACPDCDGTIEHFRLRFTADPAWHGVESPLNIETRNLHNGQGVVVKRELTYTGPGQPVREKSMALGLAFAALLLIGIAFLAFVFYRTESARGRFAYTPPSDIDEAWLNEHVFRFAPEVAGAALHDKVGAAEVAAVIAGLAQEKKIQTSVDKSGGSPKLKMHRLGELAKTDHRARLVQKLFFGGRREVDTDQIRKHYKNSGFDPAATIRKDINEQLNAIPKWKTKTRLVNWWIDVALLIAAAILFPLLGRTGNDSALASTGIFWGVVSLLPALIAAALNSRAVTRLPLRFAAVGAFLLPLVMTMTKYLAFTSRFSFGVPSMVGAILWTLAIVHVVLDALRIRDSEEKLAVRLKLASARDYFLAQLRERAPRLHDSWFPYLIAFNLGGSVESWFSANGKTTTDDRDVSTSMTTSDSTSSSSSGWSWTGGGGAFGGAGSSGSWALAAAGVASGVSAPSSSSDSGGGSSWSSDSSSSSSGGGGGGGW